MPHYLGNPGQKDKSSRRSFQQLTARYETILCRTHTEREVPIFV